MSVYLRVKKINIHERQSILGAPWSSAMPPPLGRGRVINNNNKVDLDYLTEHQKQTQTDVNHQRNSVLGSMDTSRFYLLDLMEK